MEPLLHECGVAMIRLRKPLSYYNEKYGTWAYGMNKLFLLMNKQYNRGQQGAGIACVKLKASPGEDYMFRERSEGAGAISQVFALAEKDIAKHPADKKNDAEYAYKNFGFAGLRLDISKQKTFFGIFRFNGSSIGFIQKIKPDFFFGPLSGNRY